MGGTGMHLIPLGRVSPLLPTSQEEALQLPQLFWPPIPGLGTCQLALGGSWRNQCPVQVTSSRPKLSEEARGAGLTWRSWDPSHCRTLEGVLFESHLRGWSPRNSLLQKATPERWAGESGSRAETSAAGRGDHPGATLPTSCRKGGQDPQMWLQHRSGPGGWKSRNKRSLDEKSPSSNSVKPQTRNQTSSNQEEGRQVKK